MVTFEVLTLPSSHEMNQETHNQQVLAILQKHSPISVNLTSEELTLMKAELLRYLFVSSFIIEMASLLQVEIFSNGVSE